MGSSDRVLLRRRGSCAATCAEKSRVVTSEDGVSFRGRTNVDESDLRANCDNSDVMETVEIVVRVRGGLQKDQQRRDDVT